jgi:hypothetical protein
MCYSLTKGKKEKMGRKGSGHRKCTFPYLGELGTDEPATGVYRMGFLFTAGLMAVHLQYVELSEDKQQLE